MACSDPRLTYLNSYGYNVIKLPRARIEPLQVLGRDKDSLEDLGELSTIWKSQSPIPSTPGPNPAMNINGEKTDNLKLSIGLDILASVLQGMKAAAPKLTTAYSRARAVQFTFINVTETLIAPLEVGKYLSAGDLDSGSPFVDYFVGHGKHGYVVTSVLKCASITVSAKQDSNVALAVDVPAIQQMVGANVTVSSGGSQNVDLTFKGAQPLTFGFKVFGIGYADGRWQIYGQAPSGSFALTLPTGQIPGHYQLPILLAPGALISMVPTRARQAAAV